MPAVNGEDGTAATIPTHTTSHGTSTAEDHRHRHGKRGKAKTRVKVQAITIAITTVGGITTAATAVRLLMRVTKGTKCTKERRTMRRRAPCL